MNVEQLPDSLQEQSQWTEKAKGTVRDAGAAADLYVHQYAWTSVALIALVAGALGFFLGMRR